jgi:hypothetical protein
VSFQTDTVLSRRHTFASFAGGPSDYITLQDDCLGLPVKELTVSMWVRVVGVRAKSAFMGCFKMTAADLNGWFLGTSNDGFYFVFVLRSAGANYASVIADLESPIELGAWFV